jgi:glycogen synthase
MALPGWKTKDTFNRYEIVSASDWSAGLEKVALHRASKETSGRLSLPIGPRSGPLTA